MKTLGQWWVWLILILFVVLAIPTATKIGSEEGNVDKPSLPAKRPHLDHAAFFKEPLQQGKDVTKRCLSCHKDSAKEVMQTAHFLWVGDSATSSSTGQTMRIGKKNLINNYCIGIQGNWASCTRCHAGYGWQDDSFDFSNPENVDCLVCHDWSGQYSKGKAGQPREDVDLLAAAKSVGFPKRDNCGVCHFYGGGGLGVKHGDLDATLDHPDEFDDFHMAHLDMLCVDCHVAPKHQIQGKSFSVSVNHKNGISCTDCHHDGPHADERINAHTNKVACQTCHIPVFATNIPTKMWWDWSKAGDDSRKDSVHHYLKIKGEFEYANNVVPEYRWFNLTADRYLVGDPISLTGPTPINAPLGFRDDPKAKIWPFKINRGKQPYDRVNQYLISPTTAGQGGYWHAFDWEQALRLGAKEVGLDFSGQFGFAETEMFWPLSHMVKPKEKALRCMDCHEQNGRMDWEALGYVGDPMETGGL